MASLYASEISQNLDKNKFEEMIKHAKKYIHDGDIFQVVLSRKFNFDVDGDYLKVYKVLRQNQSFSISLSYETRKENNNWIQS